MGTTQGGEYTDGRLDDVAQGHHLTGLTDTSLKDTDLRLFIKQPNGEGHANLRVVAAR